MKKNLLELINRMSEAIADGQYYTTFDHWDDGYYLAVNNPKFEPDNGEDPRMIIHISRATNIKEKIIER